jgi:hypothetical protein
MDMNAKRQAAMVKSVAKSMRAKERQQASREKMLDQVYAALRKAGKPIDEVTKAELSKAEYAIIVDYVTENGRYPLSLFPKLL